MDELAYFPAHRLARMIAAGEIGSREVLGIYLDRVERINPHVNAIVTLDAERAMEQAFRADEIRARGGSLGPLHGVPMTVKDSVETAWVRTTCGLPGLSDHVPAEDAPVVGRLRAAGAVIFGKTNTPALESMAITENPLFGVTRNPWDPTRTAGGSSGGSAAALAAGLTALELGGDDAGSNRMPAHFCGVFGHKPTHGFVPTLGHIPPMPGSHAQPDLGVLGPLARSARDLEIALRVTAGPLDDQALAWRLTLPAARPWPMRVAYWFDDPYTPLDDGVRLRLETAVKALKDAGAEVTQVHQPMGSLAAHHRMFTVLSASLFSHVLPEEEFAGHVARASDQGRAGDYARGVLTSKREWNLADEERCLLRARWADFFTHYDVLLTPVVQATAFPHPRDPGERPITVNGQRVSPDIPINAWTGLASAALLPATAAPVGLSPDGLPVGIQIIGPHLEDLTTLTLAAHLEAALPPSFPAL
ncbi:amidase family protein [Bailinhaonella thermotolerans]|uniref:Amidase n=1 Tax=Bailinhaonella thermotolerans TaxID=1070861 RepID=A0A3A4B0Z0_9ACTN|nr:amidase family protein [Bailinhaonella thermotolerans]RJL31697.1 amidase [Bailinhaonella thermotolerans]